CVNQVEAVKLLVHGKKGDVPCLRKDSDEIQDVPKGHACPLRNEGPALFASLMRDLTADRELLQIREREDSWARHHAVNGQSPIRSTLCQESYVVFVLGWSFAVDGGNFRNVAAGEFPGARITRRQKALRRVRQSFAGAQDPAVVRR